MSSLPFSALADPVDVLNHLARRKALLRISRTFRGVLLTRDLSLMVFKQNCALVQMGHHWLPARPGDAVFLTSPDFEAVVTAQVLTICLQSGEVTLGGFALIGRPWVERAHERVQPRQPVHALLRVDDRAITAPLEDFSIGGAGVLVYKPRDRGFNFSKGEALKLEFELPQVHARFSMPAHVANIRHHGGHLTCLGLATEPNNHQKVILERAVNQRKAEIMEEMEQTYKQIFQPQSVKELYF